MVATKRWNDADDQDQSVVLYGMTWRDYEMMLLIRGERAVPRMFYLDGAIELMSPTKSHEDRKTWLARLLEAWANEQGIELEGFGSWTLKELSLEAGAEPDECYLASDRDRDRPELVIEVEWSKPVGLRKHEIYRRLGVAELWTLRADGRVVVRVLVEGAWVEQRRSKVLPKLDVAWLVSFLDAGSQTKAIQAMRAAMRKKR